MTIEKNEKAMPRSIQAWLTVLAEAAVYIAIYGYIGLCVYSSMELDRAVPVSLEDLRSASWLTYTDMHYFSLFIPQMMGIAVVVVAILSAVLGRRLIPTLTMLPIGICMIVYSNEAALFRSAAVAGVSKIGCFSYEGRECREMLSLDMAGTLPMYQDPSSENGYAKLSPWYAEARKKMPDPGFFPPIGNPFLESPFVAMHAEELNTLLDVQRSELARAKESYSLAGSK